MKKYFLFLLAVLSVPSVVNGASYSRDFPQTRTQTVSVFADQLPANQMSDAQYRFAAENYVGSQKLYKTQIDKLRSTNPDFLLLHYRLAQAAGPAEGIAHDTAGSGGNIFSSEEWEQSLQNQDWFIKNNSGVKLRNTDWNWYPFDLSRSESLRNQMADYWVDRVVKETEATKSDGVFADSYGLIFGPWQTSGAKSYMFDSNWDLDVNSAKSWLSSALVPYSDRIWNQMQDEGLYYIPNCGQLITSWDTIENYTHSDGCMIEGFTGFTDSITESSDWELEMNNILALQKKGKITIAQTDFPGVSNATRRGYIIGSYLMSKGNKAYVNMFASQNSGVELQWYPEYDLDLGAYTSLPNNVSELKWNGVFRRSFAKGFVLVNPYNERKTVNLGGTYSEASFSGGGEVGSSGEKPGSVSYHEVSSVSMAPQTAAFFLSGTQDEDTDEMIDLNVCSLTRDQAYKSPASSAVFYVDVDCTKRPFKNAHIYSTYFDSWSDVEITTASKLNSIPNHALGFMPLGPLYDPNYGALVKTVTDPKVYFLLNGKKYWITSEDTFTKLNYKWNWIEDIDPRLLIKYPNGGEITDTTKHLDGTIVKYSGNAKVYVIENGKKQHIANEAQFNLRGYRWDRIVTIPSTEKYDDVQEDDDDRSPRIYLWAK